MVKLRALGESVIEVGEVRLGPDAEILFALLTYLIVERGRPISRGELIALFWAGQEEGKARHCLRQAIYKLRRMGIPIQTQRETYLLPPTCAASNLESISSFDPARGFAVLPGVRVAESAAFEVWLEELRDRSSAQIRRVLIDRLAEARRRNNWEHSARLARQCLSIDPLNEEATLTLAEEAALCGNKKEAVRILDHYLSDVGLDKHDVRFSAALLRNRIAQRVTFPPVAHASNMALVGRDSSLALLQGLAREVEAGSGQMCVIYGEAGIGKTRLLTEFANLSVMAGFRVVRASCRSDSGGRALSVLMDLAPSLLRLPGALGCDPDALMLVRRLVELTPRASVDQELYESEPGVHARLRASLQELVNAVTSESPLILMIEDIQWVDSISLSVLKELAHSNKDRPLLLTLTARNAVSGVDFSELNQRHLVQHKLESLSDADARRLAVRTCEALALQPESAVIDWCVERCEGNPLLITQLLAHYRDNGDISKVPASLDGILHERLGALSPIALRALQTISLAGQQATYERLEELLSLPKWEVLSALDELDAHGLVLRNADGLMPKHDLVSAAALTRLSRAGAAYLHYSLARSLERSIGTSGSAQLVWEAAKHWEAAGNSRRATALAGQRANHLVAIGLAHEAGALLQQAIELTSDPVETLGLYEQRSNVLRMSGEFVAMQCNAEAALRYANAHQVDVTHSIHEVHLLEAQSGHLDAAHSSLVAHALHCAADQAASHEHRLRMATWGLAACYTASDSRNGARLFEAIKDIEPASPQECKSTLECTLIYHLDFGDLDTAKAAADRLVVMESEGRPFARSRALRVAAAPHRIAGDAHIAKQYLDKAYEVALAARLPASQASVLVASAQYASDYADYQAARSFIERAQSVLSSHPYIALAQYYLVACEISLMQGDTTAASAILAQTHHVTRGPARYEFDRVALRVHLDLQSERTPRTEDITALLRFHLELRTYFGQDYPSAVLFNALHSGGQSQAAAELLEEYLARHRRMRYPPRNPLLLSIAKELT